MEDGPVTSSSSSSSSESDTSTSTSTSSSSNSTSDPSAVYVFAARYNSGLPYEGPLTMTLREYPAGVRPVGLMELVVQKRLLGSLPNNKWQVKGCRLGPKGRGGRREMGHSADSRKQWAVQQVCR
jgi:hypothetical protein